MEHAIKEFFDGRRETWLEGRLKSSMLEEEKEEMKREAEKIFSIENWLPEAARKAGQLMLVTHPPKLSHPSAKTSPIIAQNSRKNDGLLRTGNCKAELDVFGSAGALGAYNFLMLELSDGQTVLNHIEQETELIQKELDIGTITFETLRDDLLAIKKSPDENFTSANGVKQIYFPCDDEQQTYHLLSVLTPSGLTFELKKRLDEMMFSENVIEAKEKRRRREYSETGYDSVFDLTVIAFGGTNPQNISHLNSKTRGRTYLLPCLPPEVKMRAVRLPKYNFFTDTLRVNHYKERFIRLHELFTVDYQNLEIKKEIDRHILSIMDQIVVVMWKVRLSPPGWSDNSTLPIYQKTWLDNNYAEDRDGKDEGWLEQTINALNDWMITTYRKFSGQDGVMLEGHESLSFFKQIITKNVEDLR